MKNESQASPSTQKTSIAWPVSIFLCILVIAIAFTINWYLPIIQKPVDTVSDAVSIVVSWPEKLAKATGELLQAKTTITGTIISLPTDQIAELALIKRRILVFTKQDNTSWGSTSVRIINGEFELKAGYDLQQVSITFNESDKTVRITLPKPKILSLTTINQGTYHLDKGIIKGDPTTEEDDIGNQENRKQAYTEAMKLGLGEEVEQRMKERIRDLFSAFTDPDKIMFIDAGIPPNDEPSPSVSLKLQQETVGTNLH